MEINPDDWTPDDEKDWERSQWDSEWHRLKRLNAKQWDDELESIRDEDYRKFLILKKLKQEANIFLSMVITGLVFAGVSAAIIINYYY